MVVIVVVVVVVVIVIVIVRQWNDFVARYIETIGMVVIYYMYETVMVERFETFLSLLPMSFLGTLPEALI